MESIIANKTLRYESGNSIPNLRRSSDLEARILEQAEELAMLYEREGEYIQQIIDLNNKQQDMNKILQIKEVRIVEILKANNNLHREISKYIATEKELNDVKDEYQVLEICFASLEKKLRKTQEENRQLNEQLMEYKATEEMNEKNILINRDFIEAKLQEELKNAACDI